MVEMHHRMVTLVTLSLALLTLSGAWAKAQQRSSGLESGPFFVWSDQPYMASDSLGSTSRAWYEVRVKVLDREGNPSYQTIHHISSK